MAGQRGDGGPGVPQGGDRPDGRADALVPSPVSRPGVSSISHSSRNVGTAARHAGLGIAATGTKGPG
ncbi:hypothetical protein ACWCQS_45705 [Streptomyces sp. NPDC002076]